MTHSGFTLGRMRLTLASLAIAALCTGCAIGQSSAEPIVTASPAAHATRAAAPSVPASRPARRPVTTAPPTHRATVSATHRPASTTAHVASLTPSHVAAVTTAPRQAPRVQSAATTLTPVEQIRAIYNRAVPAWERNRLAGRYVLAYRDPTLSCGAGCTAPRNGHIESSFGYELLYGGYSWTHQNEGVAHEAAHAYGFLYLRNYPQPNWSNLGGWQARFHQLDRSFAGQLDAEAFATCVVASEVSPYWRPDQVRGTCPASVASWVMRQIS